MQHSSCFVFHKDMKLRKTCLSLLYAPPQTKQKELPPDFTKLYESKLSRKISGSKVAPEPSNLAGTSLNISKMKL